MAKNSVVYLAIVTGDTPAQTIMERHVGKYDNPAMAVELVRDLLARAAGGVEDAVLHLFQDKGDGTQASGTITCTQAAATAGETCSVAGVVFTVASSPSTDPARGEVSAGADDTAFGDNLAAAINAHPYLKGLVTAANAAGVVTVTAVDKGLFGNLISLAETGDCFAVSGAVLTSGARGTAQAEMRTFRRGL